MGGEKGGPAPLSQAQVRERAIICRAFNKDPCFALNHFPLLLGSHDTGGSAAGHLTPPAAVDVVHHDVTSALPSSLRYRHSIISGQQQKHLAAPERNGKYQQFDTMVYTRNLLIDIC